MESFCHGRLWNSSLLVDSAWPHFTDCFIHTLVIWLPCGFLALALPGYVISVRRSTLPVRGTGKAALFGARLCLCITLAAVSLLHLLMRSLAMTVSTSPAAYLGDALYITCYMTMCAMTQYERVKGVHTSAVPVFFWLLMCLCNIIPFYTLVLEKRYLQFQLSFAFFLLSYILQLCSLTLTAFVNNQLYKTGQTCPESTCSFPSYLTFWWMTRLVVTGYRRDLEEADLWQLPPGEQSERLSGQFNALWTQELQTTSSDHGKSQPKGHRPKETSPLLDNQSLEETCNYTQDDDEEGQSSRSPRLLWTMLRLMGKDFLCIFLQKTVSDLLFLCTPMLMGLLLGYLASRETGRQWQGYGLCAAILLALKSCLCTVCRLLLGYLATRETGRQWQGYGLCAAMFLALIIKSLLFAHSMFRAARVGIRLKSILIAAIYHKALTMSSATKWSASVGEIINLMSVDAQRVQDMMIVCFYAATTPLQFVVAVGLLYVTIGPAIFVGVLLLLCCIPLNIYVVSKQRHLQNSNLTLKDARVNLYNEILSGIKVLKLYAWEPSFREKIREIRLKEVAILFKMAVLNTLMSLCWDLAPYMVTLATFAAYVLTSPDGDLDAGKAFVSLALFNVLRPPLALLSKMVTYLILVQVSIKRIHDFLTASDLDPDAVEYTESEESMISIRNGMFAWNNNMSPVLKHVDVEVGEGQLVAVVGSVGSGKSSLVNAILGEMTRLQGTVRRKGRIAYVPQQAWIQNSTVRENILFGRPFNQYRYSRVLERCELDRDMTVLSAGDMTEIGEKGINLNGGQKQRVSLARAVYSDSDVYLLDDPLSAVDSHVGKAIFTKVIGPNGHLRRKTRVLVTHGVHWLPMVDEVIVMHDGKVSERGSYEELVSHDGPFAQFLKTYLTELFEAEEKEGDPEIEEIHGRMRKRLGSVTSYASSEDDSLRTHTARRRRTGTNRSQGGISRELRLGLVSDGDTDSELGRSDRFYASDTVSRDGLDRQSSKETVSQGKVGLAVFWYYASAAGILPLLLAFGSFCVFQAFSVGANFWLKEWTRHSQEGMATGNLSWYDGEPNATIGGNDTDVMDTSSVGSVLDDGTGLNGTLSRETGRYSSRFYLAVYGILGVGQVLFLLTFNGLHWSRMLTAARRLHSRLADSLMHAPMAFFDTTPIGAVLNRVCFDMETVDTSLPLVTRDWLVMLGLVLVTLAVIVMQTPLSAVVLLPLVCLYFVCQRFYVPTARQLRRLECVTRSPIYVLFSETLSGAASIRAYGVTRWFLRQSMAKVDKNQVYFFAYQAAVRWMQWNLDVVSAVVVLATSMFAIADTATEPGDAGLCISYALQISGTLTWLTRQTCEIETKIVSVERLKQYSDLEQEADWVRPNSRPDPLWPRKGEVTFINYQTRYRKDLDLVLKGVTFTIANGEKVGIVGRTGAGKSSLTLSLFRLIEAAGGRILIDGVNIAEMGLHDLRSHLTILPQDPVLFSGSLRMNLDPFDEYSDDQLWTALDRAHLREAVQALPGHLDFLCGEEGGNLSVGQRQLVCLARTLLRRTKILVLDEATAAVDMETDALIQNTIRTAFTTRTVITIAHRLNTIMDYDRILVMENGKVAEYAPPGTLLAHKGSLFFQMARDARLV